MVIYCKYTPCFHFGQTKKSQNYFATFSIAGEQGLLLVEEFLFFAFLDELSMRMTLVMCFAPAFASNVATAFFAIIYSPLIT